MNRHGSTTIETKSGYGLDLKSEIKSLQAIRDAAAVFSGTVVSTLLGAHVVPHDFADNRDEYIRIVCDEMIPAAAKRPPRRAGRTARTANGQSQTAECESSLASFVDVFCERSAFTLEETRRIFSAARQHGLGIRIHLGQLSETPLADLLQFDPASFDHMNHIRDADLPRLAKSNSVVTLLPGADYFLATPYASARKFIDAAVAVALATDFNPGTSPTLSMPMVLSLACTQMRMSPAEAITAATINGAAALRLASSKGSIEAGKDADLAIFDVPDYREIPYWFGQNRCWAVVTLGHFQQVK
jgi:imidazolonepropionase